MGAMALLLGLVAAPAGCVGGGEQAEAGPATFPAYLDERVPELMQRYDIPGVAIALIEEGEFAWSGAYGYADRGAGRAMTTHAVVRAESISMRRSGRT